MNAEQIAALRRGTHRFLISRENPESPLFVELARYTDIDSLNHRLLAKKLEIEKPLGGTCAAEQDSDKLYYCGEAKTVAPATRSDFEQALPRGIEFV